MSSFIAAWQMVAKRSLAHWKLLSAVVIGVVLAVAIMASTIIYFDTLRELALSHALSQHSSSDLDILLRAEHGPTTPLEYRKINNYVKTNIDQRVGWFVQGRFQAVKSATFNLILPYEEDPPEENNRRAYFQYFPDLEQHIQLIAGRLPSSMTSDELGGGPIEAAITPDTANLFNLTLGSTLVVVPFWEDASSSATVVITGIIQPQDPDEEYWLLEQKVFLFGPSSLQFVPLFVPNTSYIGTVGGMFPRMTSTYAWLLDTEPGRIHSRSAATAKAGIDSLNDELGSTLTSYRQTSVLDPVLGEFDRRLFFTKLPMFVVLIIIVAVILYYVVIVSSLLVEQQRGEIALLRSRGASSAQVLGVYVMEGMIISLLAVLAGPFIAVAAITVLGSTPAFSDLSGGEFIVARISGPAILMGLLGGALSFLALLIPSIQASRISLVHYKQRVSRPNATPAFQRYYLDLMLLAVGLLLFREISRQGSVVAKGLLGEEAVNNLLLALPAFILAGAAMFLLRLFPIVMGLLSRLLSPILPAGLVLGLWQMARNPTHYARLILLLILASGLGIFAASFGGTLERSFQDRARYATGADIRLEGVAARYRGPGGSFMDSFQQVEGISKVSPAYRGRGTVFTELTGENYTLFAVDPETFPSVAWFRDDFTPQPVEELLQPLANIELPQGIKLPEDATTLGLWVRPDEPHRGISMQAHMRDSQGRYFTFALGTLGSEEWSFLETSITSLPWGRRNVISPSPPLTLVSLFVMERRNTIGIAAGSVLLDELQVRLRDGTTIIVEPFEDTQDWQILGVAPQSASDSLDILEGGGYEGGKAGIFTWTSGSALVARGVFHGPEVLDIPVLASTSFMEEASYRVGDRLEVSVSGQRRVTVIIADTVNYFATLDPNVNRFLIADISTLSRYVNLAPLALGFQPNEAWLSTDLTGDARSNLLLELTLDSFSVRQIHDLEESLAASRVDPLVAAGWRSLLFVAFFTVLFVSSLGFLIHAYVSFRSREMEFALLRTIGLSLRQLMTLIWLEQLLVIGVGMALGTWMGGRLGATIMPFLSHTDEGLQALPPFVLEINWGALAITYLLIALFFSLTILGSIWSVHKIPLQRILRLGEM